MLTPRRSAVISAAARVRIRCVVAGREDALAEYPCVLSAASNMAHGIVLAPSRLVNRDNDDEIGANLGTLVQQNGLGKSLLGPFLFSAMCLPSYSA
jgi:hypothetical protein